MNNAPRRRIAPPCRDDADRIRGFLLDGCLDGQCYELAIALHRHAGLPLVGLWSSTATGADGVPGTWRHAAVAFGDGFFDARGMVGAEEFGTPFDEPRPWDIRAVDESDLRRVRPVAPERVELVARLARAAWPDLPWRASSPLDRMAAFLADLEDLSRRHAIWIRAPYPTAAPFLSGEEDDSARYGGRVTADGLAVRFDREYGENPCEEDDPDRAFSAYGR